MPYKKRLVMAKLCDCTHRIDPIIHTLPHCKKRKWRDTLSEADTHNIDAMNNSQFNNLTERLSRINEGIEKALFDRLLIKRIEKMDRELEHELQNPNAEKRNGERRMNNM